MRSRVGVVEYRMWMKNYKRIFFFLGKSNPYTIRGPFSSFRKYEISLERLTVTHVTQENSQALKLTPKLLLIWHQENMLQINLYFPEHGVLLPRGHHMLRMANRCVGEASWLQQLHARSPGGLSTARSRRRSLPTGVQWFSTGNPRAFTGPLKCRIIT